MICRTKRSGCVPIAASTASNSRHRRFAVLVIVVVFVAPFLQAQTVDPEIAHLLERVLINAEQFRKQLSWVEYEARMRVQEWDGRLRLRGRAKAHAIMRPGNVRPIEFLSREVEGKVRLPDDKENKSDPDEKEVTLQEFAQEHRIAERFQFDFLGPEEVAGGRARRVSFTPKQNQPEKNTADRFLDATSGTAWVAEEESKLVKFEMRLLHPFQLFWIFAVLKDRR